MGLCFPVVRARIFALNAGALAGPIKAKLIVSAIIGRFRLNEKCPDVVGVLLKNQRCNPSAQELILHDQREKQFECVRAISPILYLTGLKRQDLLSQPGDRLCGSG